MSQRTVAKAVKSTKKVATLSQAAFDKKVNASFSDNALKMMKKRYLAKRDDGTQETPAELYHRVAHGLATIEREKYGKSATEAAKIEQEFFEIMANKEHTPAGRTLTNVGLGTPIIANCIVLPIPDTLDEIFQTLKEAALLQQAGSGLGFSFGHMRPAGTPTKRTNGMSSGPVEFLKIYNTAFGIIKQQGRHGANMAIMPVDHPDILDFIHCKSVEGSIRNFNISVGITDEFMKAVTEKPNEPWLATFNGKKMKPRRVLRAGNGSVTGFEELDITAQQLFNELVEGAWHNGEPGVVNLDEANRTNPLPQLGKIDSTNPCGEQFLHHYDVCNLGSINLSAFVKNGKMDFPRLRQVTRTAVRLHDNVIDLYSHPVQKVTDRSQSTRRIGLGIMGFADMLYKLGIQYNSPEGRAMAEKVMRFVNEESHKMSQFLAKEKGTFALWKDSAWGKKKLKMRNAALTTVAPTGSISMFTDCSSGIEPNFALYFTKQDKDGVQYKYLNPVFEQALKDRGIDIEKSGVMAELMKTGSVQNLPSLPKDLRDTFVVSMDISAQDHIQMQAAFQKHVDNSISKTINFPNSATREEVAAGYVLAWRLKCKGMTFYRDGSREVQVLNIGSAENIKSTTEGFGASGAAPAQKIEKPMNLAIDAGKLSPRVRPDVVSGKTYKVKTGYGILFVTVNDDEFGAPIEVFATLGKSGGFFQEQSEALCRLISIALRSHIKVEEIIKQLKGIRGPMPVMTNRGTILSLPDAVAQILEEHVTQGASKPVPEVAPQLVNASASTRQSGETGPVAAAVNESSSKKQAIANFGMMPGCPDCGGNLALKEGCMSCPSCGFSRCG
jgi:ribonucleoside-diphosphate reductase alpha chain